MFEYAICNVGGKQIKIIPGQEFEIPLQSSSDEMIVKVLLKVEKDKIEIGNPYLKDELKLKVLGNSQKKKIRVSKFHAKANYRRTTGIHPQVTRVVLSA